MKPKQTAIRYIWWGALFGLAFPVVSIGLDQFLLREEPVDLATLIADNPVHLIVALAPFVLGAVFGLLGRAHDQKWNAISERAARDHRFRQFVRGVREYAIYTLDEHGRVMDWNAGAERVKGYTAEEIVGKNYACFYSRKDQSAGIPKQNLEAALRNSECEREGWRYRKDGTRFWAHVIIQPVFEGFRLVGFSKITRDCTEQMESERQLKQMASRDGLTGLLNREHFLQTLDSELWQRMYAGGFVALAYFDIDRFKDVNEAIGHMAGDEILAAVSKKLSAVLQDKEVAGRFGGDEFVVMKTYAQESELDDFIERLKTVSHGLVHLSKRSYSVSACVGLAVYPLDAQDSDTLLNNADLAVRRAKTSSDNVVRYTSEMDQEERERRALAADMLRALEENEFFLHYQPQFDIRSMTVIGYEALLRWKHPEKGLISPGVFIPIAERHGLIQRIGDWVLEKACEETVDSDFEGRIAINVSGVQLSDPEFCERLKGTLVRTGMSPTRLELEVTETAIITDKQQALHALRQIRSLGIAIALDDFGTGYSSLDTLQSFPFDKLKLDQAFAGGLESSDQAKAIVRAVIALGKSFELPVLAEGIEKESQLDVLLAEGCHEVQGFLLGRPAVWESRQSHAEGVAAIRSAS
ncbi:putative bifunctional diguanylate cyclase/phosphodiesterase [Notoacmeibacter ruber]|uniref:EAL domain-containing protein n=1 Tax=Notoacmeibacter ruber TaxID=2670375 RepID=A0A3L7JDB6_9HYPH|nr:EAL domain-containing protein [Notoacmeibacter ruber]RLQ87571.1 EAL domain-containing protein [Notoacmeibacter ruber]